MKRLLTALLLFAFCSNAYAEYPWQLRKNEDGIQIYTRKVKGSPYLEFIGRMILDTTPEKAAAFYGDEKAVCGWYYHCIESKLISQPAEDEKLLYFAMDMPWPVKDRDVVYVQKRLPDPKQEGGVKYELAGASGKTAAEKGRVRAESLKGMWRFIPAGGGKTEVFYQQHGDAGGHIPAFLVNKLSVDIPFESFQKFREEFYEKTPKD